MRRGLVAARGRRRRRPGGRCRGTGTPSACPSSISCSWPAVLFWVAQATSWNILSGYSGLLQLRPGRLLRRRRVHHRRPHGRHGLDFFATLPVAALLSVGLALASAGWRSGCGRCAARSSRCSRSRCRSSSRRSSASARRSTAARACSVPVPRRPRAVGGVPGVPVPRQRGHRAAARSPSPMRCSTPASAGACSPSATPRTSPKSWACRRSGSRCWRSRSPAASAALAGCVYALQVGYVTVEGVFSLTVPLFVIVMSVLGGRFHWLGPALGALVIVHPARPAGGRRVRGAQPHRAGAGAGRARAAGAGGAHRAPGASAPWPSRSPSWARSRSWRCVGTWGARSTGSPWPCSAAAVVAFLPVPRRRIAREVTRLRWTDALPPTRRAEDGRHAIAEPVDRRRRRSGARAALSAAAPAVLVECHDLTRSFGGVQALRGVSLESSRASSSASSGRTARARRRSSTSSPGRSGPTSGELRVAGRSIVGVPPHRIAHLGVARTYQIPRPFDSMTVRDNVAMAIMFGRAPRPLHAARRRAQEHLDLVGLTHLAEARPAEVNLHERSCSRWPAPWRRGRACCCWTRRWPA